jgi:hypothetical protein
MSKTVKTGPTVAELKQQLEDTYRTELLAAIRAVPLMVTKLLEQQRMEILASTLGFKCQDGEWSVDFNDNNLPLSAELRDRATTVVCKMMEDFSTEITAQETKSIAKLKKVVLAAYAQNFERAAFAHAEGLAYERATIEAERLLNEVVAESQPGAT